MSAFTPTQSRRGHGRLLAFGGLAALALLLAQNLFSPPMAVVAPATGPSLYVNTYVPGENFSNTVLWFGARYSIGAAHATVYVEEREPMAIAQRIHATAEAVGRPLERVTIAGHGKPGGVMLDRSQDARAEEYWLLASHTLLDWMAADVAEAVMSSGTIVFESCDTSPIVNGAPAAESVAFRRAVAATFGVATEHIVLFRGPAKYAWGFDGWTPRTYPLEIVFDDPARPEAAA